MTNVKQLKVLPPPNLVPYSVATTLREDNTEKTEIVYREKGSFADTLKETAEWFKDKRRCKLLCHVHHLAWEHAKGKSCILLIDAQVNPVPDICRIVQETDFDKMQTRLGPLEEPIARARSKSEKMFNLLLLHMRKCKTGGAVIYITPIELPFFSHDTDEQTLQWGWITFLLTHAAAITANENSV